jgi:Flp pilus assembly protein TadD
MGFLNKLFGNNEDDPKKYLEQGKVLILNGDLDEGIKLLRKARGLDPYITHRIYNIANKLHAGAKSKNKAAGGNIYFSDGIVELEAAIAIMELLSEFESNNAEIWSKLGVLYDNHCYFDKAVKAYERAANLDPEGPDGADT